MVFTSTPPTTLYVSYPKYPLFRAIRTPLKGPWGVPGRLGGLKSSWIKGVQGSQSVGYNLGFRGLGVWGLGFRV